MTITRNSDSIKIKGYYGTWYVIDAALYGEWYFLLEHETYGDEVASLIVDSEGNVIVDDVYNGWDSLEGEYSHLKLMKC